MMNMSVIDKINSVLWGNYTVALVLIAGVFHAVRTVIPSVGRLRADKSVGGGKRSVATALAASMGTGNITGCAAAVMMGGAGAVFWMWAAAVPGMALAFAENRIGTTMADRYGNRQKGPLLYIEKALSHGAAGVYGVCCVCAAICMGCMSQSGAMCQAIGEELELPLWVIALIPALLTAAAIFSGRDASAVTERLVPVMGLLYGAGCTAVLIIGGADVPSAFSRIAADAFSFRAVSGGMTGTAISIGLRRGIFSNEAGMGSSVLVHCDADFGTAERSGMWAAFEVFLDTMVCCTLTALVVVSYNSDTVGAAFEYVLGKFGGVFLCICICLFAWAAMLGWCCYGERSIAALGGGVRAGRIYRTVYTAAAFVGGIIPLGAVFGLCDIINFAMLFINLTAITVIVLNNKQKL